jgi:SAM-dependent methyltransferase
MIGRRRLPAEYRAWNEAQGAPFGFAGNERYVRGENPLASLRDALRDGDVARHGPFGFQYASYTRLHEYPWAFHNAGLEPGMAVLDIGGGTTGLQYIAALNGCSVVNVEPASSPGVNEWADEALAERHAMINEALGTQVRLVSSQIQEAVLPSASYDRIFCLSVLEHVPPAEANDMVAAAGRLLKPGGLLLMTVDLFLDLEPFGVLTRNSWGVNHNVAELIKHTGLELVQGDRRELLGSAEFDRDRVVALLPELLISDVYPVMTQSLILGGQAS